MKSEKVKELTMGELAEGTVVGGRWRVVYKIDSGGGSIVYCVVEIGGEGRTAALKIRRLDTEHPKELFENDIQFLRDQWIDGDMPEWFDDGEYEGRRYVVMTLLEELPRPMTAKEAKRYFRPAAKILKRLHKLKIIHGDIKLGNFALMNGKVVLTDFETATHVKEGEDSVPVVVTPFYLAPEMLNGGPMRLTYKTDVYAFGVTFENACLDDAAKVFDKVHRLTVAATPKRRCDDWDAICRAIWWAGRRWLVPVVAVGGVVVLVVAVVIVMAVVGSHTVDRALSQNGELHDESHRKAAEYEKKVGDEEHAVRNEAISRGEGEGD